jgi:hypothetical protein
MKGNKTNLKNLLVWTYVISGVFMLNLILVISFIITDLSFIRGFFKWAGLLALIPLQVYSALLVILMTILVHKIRNNKGQIHLFQDIFIAWLLLFMIPFDFYFIDFRSSDYLIGALRNGENLTLLICVPIANLLSLWTLLFPAYCWKQLS